MSHLNPGVSLICADWWAERWQLSATRESFRVMLKLRLFCDAICEEDRFSFGIRLEVDYDPFGTLLEIVRDLGIECRGFCDSARDILPMKTRMKIYTTGGVEISDGKVAPVWLIPRVGDVVGP